MRKTRSRRRAIAILILAWAASPLPSSSQSLGDLLYPKDSINANIDRLQSAVQSLIDTFGKTVDDATLKALERALTGVQSARVAYSGALNQTMAAVGQQRAALLYQLADQVLELKKAFGSGTTQLGESEQRVTHTLEEIARSSQAPWVIDYEPQLYRPDRSGPITVSVTGQNLSNPANRLVVGKAEVTPSVNLANKIEFQVDRNLLAPDKNGFATLVFRAPVPDTSWFSWIGGHAPPAPAEYKLIARAMGPDVGTYTVDTEVPTGNGYDDRTTSFGETNPVAKEECLKQIEGEEFDPGYSKAQVTKNDVYFAQSSKQILVPAYGGTRIGGIPIPIFRPVTQIVPAHTNPGPANSAVVSHNTPERVCVTLNSAAPANASTRVEATLDYRVHYLQTQYKPIQLTGSIPWDKDTPVVFPPGFNGFRATINFSNAEQDKQRTFVAPQSYGPLEITLDPNSRTLLFRPLSVQ